jgi:hypothetical protein
MAVWKLKIGSSQLTVKTQIAFLVEVA